MNFNRQEKLIVGLIGAVLLLIVVIGAGIAVYLVSNRPQADAPAELIPTADTSQIAAETVAEEDSEPDEPAKSIPATFTPVPAKPTSAPSPTSTPIPLPPTFTPESQNMGGGSGGGDPSGDYGTFGNPVPIGTSYRFPGYGTMTVTESRWQTGQSGLAIVQISFTCERPSDQPCDVLDFMLDAVGSSGSTYNQAFESGVPEPDFWDFMTNEVYGGGTKTGYAGFLIDQYEIDLMMTVKIFLGRDNRPTFFDISR